MLRIANGEHLKLSYSKITMTIPCLYFIYKSNDYPFGSRYCSDMIPKRTALLKKITFLADEDIV